MEVRAMNSTALLLWQEPSATPQNIQQVFSELRDRFLSSLPGLMTGALIFSIFYLAAFGGARLISYAAPRVKADTGVVLLLSRVYYYTLIILGLVTGLGATGLNVNALVAGLGLTGFALGFALKDVLANLLSGIMLLVYQPFRIEDQIRIDNYEGTIKTIRMRDTVLRSYDGRNIIIPNSKLITEVVVNNTTAKLRRESITIAIPSDANVNEACELFLQAMQQHSTITGRVEMPLRATYTAEEIVLIEGRFWYEPRVNAKVVESEVAQTVKTALERAHIEMFFPTEEEIVRHLSKAQFIEEEEMERR
jgi:small conductance mechanosensitive channel